MVNVTTCLETNRVTGSAKVVAFFNGKTASIQYDYSYNRMPNHIKAAAKVLRKVDTNMKLSGNNIKCTSAGYVFQVIRKGSKK